MASGVELWPGGVRPSAAQRFPPSPVALGGEASSFRDPSGDRWAYRLKGVGRWALGVKDADKEADRQQTKASYATCTSYASRPRPVKPWQPWLPCPLALLHCTITRFLNLHKSPSSTSYSHAHSLAFAFATRILRSITHTRLAPHFSASRNIHPSRHLI